MSIHRECGAEIQWLRREDDESRYMPPMEYAGEVFVKNEDGKATRTHAYRQHLCDPEAIIAWADYQRRLAEAKGEEYTPYQAAREREAEQMWEFVLPYTCPRCHAVPGQKCISQKVANVKQGLEEETRNPHPARIEAAMAAKELGDG